MEIVTSTSTNASDTAALDRAIVELQAPLTTIVAVDDDGGVVFVCDQSNPLIMREKITRIGEVLLKEVGACDLPVTHEFADGLYIRKMLIPKGTLIVGKVHKRECVNVVERGDIAVLTESGAMRVRAGFTSVTPPGIQKLGFANEETVFINIFRADKKEIDALEAELVCDTVAEYEASLQGDVIEEGVCLQD